MDFFRSVIQKYITDEMSVYAAQASFFTILAAFPFLMLLFALINLIPQVHESDLMTVLTALMPDHLDPLIMNVMEHIRTRSPATILSASALLSLWSSAKGMLSMERGMNRAYLVHVQRNYFIRRLICSGYTFFFSIMCAISLIFHFSACLVLFLFILIFYMVLPYRPQRLLSQVPGALFSTAGWGIASSLFSLYFQVWERFTQIYGSLTAVILLMLWLYICICILFFGAEINVVLSDERVES